MKLEDFVAETIKEIINGVVAAQQHAVEYGAKVNPPIQWYINQGLVLTDPNTGCKLQEVEFDVAVTTTEGSSLQGGFGVFVGPVAVGSKGKTNAENQSVSRIKFSLPMSLPPGGEEPPPQRRPSATELADRVVP